MHVFQFSTPPGIYLLYEALFNASSLSMFILPKSFESGFAKVSGFTVATMAS